MPRGPERHLLLLRARTGVLDVLAQLPDDRLPARPTARQLRDAAAAVRSGH